MARRAWCGMALLARWRRAGRQPMRDITVMGIRAEEMCWFPTPYIGSRAAFGLLAPDAPDTLRRTDSGRTLAEHMAEEGFDPDCIRQGSSSLDPAYIHAFIELHIEQGPVLVEEGLPVGIVTGIRGNIRYRALTVTGRYGACRRRAAAVAAGRGAGGLELVMACDRSGSRTRGGQGPGLQRWGVPYRRRPSHTMTTIPGEVLFSLDIRSETSTCCSAIHRQLADGSGDRLAARRDIRLRRAFEPTPARRRSNKSSARTAKKGSPASSAFPAMPMASGAGHDSAEFGTQAFRPR